MVGTTSQEVHDMTIVRRTSSLGELVSLRHAMDRLFEDSFVRPRGSSFGSEFAGALPLDVTSTPDALLVEAALPGVRPEDVDITVEDGTLTIRGESNDEREEVEGETIVKEIRRGLDEPHGHAAERARRRQGVRHLRARRPPTHVPAVRGGQAASDPDQPHDRWPVHERLERRCRRGR